MPFTELTLSDPIPDLHCLNCGEVHRYDGVNGWECCLVMEDTRFIPPKVACWCDEACFNSWLDSPKSKELFPTM